MLPYTSSLNAPLLADAIQLSIAPVFLLTAIGAFLSAITARLGRVIDRARVLENRLPSDFAAGTDEERAALHKDHQLILKELATLDRRMVLANRAVGLSVASALTVCVLITLLFVSSVSPLHPDYVVPVLFIAALIFLIAAMLSFAVEISISIRTVRVRAEYIRNAPRPPGDLKLDRWH